jgi:hypothetical protein
MKYRLRSYELTPPGGYPYAQTEGIPRQFPSQPLIEAQAQMVASFRRANKLPRATALEALQDIDCYTCQRLGNMPGFCVATDQPTPVVALNQTSPIVAPGCGGCGAPL